MATSALKSALAAASSFMLLGIAPALAGDDGARAEAYFQAITGRDAETIASFYADDAEFKWVGGPLAGTYNGKEQIRGVWERFANAAGTFTHEVLDLSESADGKISTVTARVMFKGQTDVPVKFDMTYAGGKIATETWQVDKTAASARAEPNSGAKPTPSEVETAATVAVVEAPPAPEQAAEPKAQVSEATPEPPAPEQAAEPKAKVSEATPEPDYLPKGAVAPAAKTKAAGSTNAKPEAKAKTADGRRSSRKKRRYYEDDDYARSGPGYDRYARNYDRYDRDYDYGRYGYRPYGGGYGVYGPPRGFGLRLFGGFIGFGGYGGFGGHGRY